MALFIRKGTKKSIWSAQGSVSFRNFVADKDKPAFNISMIDEDGKTHSISIYGEEVEQLKEVLNHGNK